MSKGNINYKYLRRRKNWFQRNWKALIIYIVLILAVLGAGAFVCIRFTPLGSKLGITQGNESKENKASPGADNNAQGDGSNKNNGEQQTKEVTWIDLKEPEQQKEVSYTVPAGVAYPYHIKVNRAANCVTVYGIDESGSYSIPVKAFAASCGRAGEETITGENYKTSDMYVWRLMVDNTYGHYAYRISGGYLFHSVPYLKAANNTLETEEYMNDSTAGYRCICDENTYVEITHQNSSFAGISASIELTMMLASEKQANDRIYDYADLLVELANRFADYSIQKKNVVSVISAGSSNDGYSPDPEYTVTVHSSDCFEDCNINYYVMKSEDVTAGSYPVIECLKIDRGNDEVNFVITPESE